MPYIFFDEVTVQIVCLFFNLVVYFSVVEFLEFFAQNPLSMGFSRQEYRSGLPFPSPMHESEK